MSVYNYSKRNGMLLKNLDEAIRYYQTELLPVQLTELNICSRALDPALGFSDKEIAEIFVSGWHQKRIPKKDVISDLVRFPHLWTAVYSSFKALYGDVTRCLEETYRCGYLTYYDIAKRIGHIRGLQPEEVCICSDTVQTAAENFLGKKGLSLGTRLPVSDFAALKPLTAIEIENFLCVFSDYLVCGGIHMPAEDDFDDVRYRNFYSDELLHKLRL